MSGTITNSTEFIAAYPSVSSRIAEKILQRHAKQTTYQSTAYSRWIEVEQDGETVKFHIEWDGSVKTAPIFAWLGY